MNSSSAPSDPQKTEETVSHRQNSSVKEGLLGTERRGAY